MKRKVLKLGFIGGIVIFFSLCLFPQNQKNGFKFYVDNLLVPMEYESDFPITNIFYRTPQLFTYYMENYMFAPMYGYRDGYINRLDTATGVWYYRPNYVAGIRTAYASELFLEINDSITNYLINHNLYDYAVKYYIDDEFMYGSNAYWIVRVDKSRLRNYTLICDTLNKEILVDICLNDSLTMRRFVKNKIYKVGLNDEIKEFIKSDILKHNQLDSERDVLEVTFNMYYNNLCMALRNVPKREIEYYDNYFTGYDSIDSNIVIVRMLTGDGFKYVDKIKQDTISFDKTLGHRLRAKKFLYNYSIDNGEYKQIRNNYIWMVRQDK